MLCHACDYVILARIETPVGNRAILGVYEVWWRGVAQTSTLVAKVRSGRSQDRRARSVIERKDTGMGKYKQWLHHQEIGRRLRDQINTYEQERARVQKMAPVTTTALPELENPVIAALLNYTRAGNKLSNIDVIKAAMPKMDPDLEQRRPAPSAATYAPGEETAPGRRASTDDAVVAGLQARADSMPTDPFDPARNLSARDRIAGAPTQPNPSGSPNAGSARNADSLGAWFQNQQSKE